MSTWLVTGAGGLLGSDLVPELLRSGHDVVARSRADLDVTDPEAVMHEVETSGADVVVNAAAYTKVDEAESAEHLAQLVNADGTANIATACAQAPRAPVLLQLSTDYVFDGAARSPYAEEAPTAPRSAYGRSKLAGERAVLRSLPRAGFVVRTAWLYGVHGPSFVATMVRLERERDLIDVVADQHGQPTSTRDLAVRLRELGEGAVRGAAPAGVYHATASGQTTWFGLAQQVFRLLGADPGRVRPTTTSRFPRPASRPAWSVLGHERWQLAGLGPMRDWAEALAEVVPDLAARAGSA